MTPLRALARYGLTVAAVGIATAVRWALREELGSMVPFATYYAAVTAAAFLGTRFAVFATVLSAVVAVYLFMPPYYTFVMTPPEAWSVGIFVVVCFAISGFSHALHGARRRAEETAERARQLSAIVESSSDPVVGKSLDLQILSWNRAAEERYGFLAEEAVGRHVSLFVPEDRIKELEDAISRIASGERVAPFETVRRRKDGAAVEISLAVSPIRNAAGRVVGVSGIDRDLSARKREERRLALLAGVSDVFLHSGLDFKKAAAEIVRRTAAVMGDLCVIRLISTDRSSLEPIAYHHTSPEADAMLAELIIPEPTGGQGLLARVLTSNEALLVPRVDTAFLRSVARPETETYAARFTPHTLLMVPMRLGSRPVGVLSVARNSPGPPYTVEDQTLLQAIADRAAATLENARLYEQVSVANHLKDDFLSTLSHELRTPLNAILGWSTLLHGGNLSAEDQTRAIGAILRNTEAQNRLIAEILDMSRMASGKLRIEVESVDLPAVIERAVETVAPAARAKQVRLRTILDPAAGPVSGDAQRLQQVVWNVLSNSIKFTPRGGQVEVRLERVDSHVEIAVQDTGIGISADFLPHVFELFRQADSSPSRQHGGLGLGLALAKHLVELHGGTIEASSPGDGGGTLVRVKLPLRVVHPSEQPGAARGPAEATTPTAGGELEGVKVLVVDDDPEAQSLLRTVLERSGATVIVAPSAARGLVELSSRRPDVLVSDIGLPGEDGYALIRQVRALPPDLGGRVPAAAVTAYARAEDRLNALQAGYQVHMAKPLVPAELIAAVRSLAGRY
ncbi:MAG TPA: ATP-binding protein [Vicinamibacteria bacterium]